MSKESNKLHNFVKKIRKNVPNASYRIEIHENTIITFWVENKFIQIDPILDENGNLVYTSIRITEEILGYTTSELLIAKNIVILYKYHKTGYSKYTFEYVGESPKIPIILTNEEEFFKYVNDLGPTDLKEEFRVWSGFYED
jgi:hypothetical protein